MGCFKRTALKHVYYLGWNRSPAQVGCMNKHFNLAHTYFCASEGYLMFLIDILHISHYAAFLRIFNFCYQNEKVFSFPYITKQCIVCICKCYWFIYTNLLRYCKSLTALSTLICFDKYNHLAVIFKTRCRLFPSC